MSMLTPLYVLGLAAVSLPVIFHLIRRMPRGETQFSSLMFLSPSPPRLTRRSRLENILLLVLRGLALSLLAFAFARPFLRQEVPQRPSDADQSRVAIVLDTSASMRRGDLWQQAVAAVNDVVAESRPYDQLALFTCDESLRPLIGFDDMTRIPPGQRRQTVEARLKESHAAWSATHLGQALMDVVDIVNDVAESANDGAVARRVVLVSDLQQGGRLAALADYPWPAEVALDLRTVTLPEKTNAGLHRLADRQASAQPGVLESRIRVSNDAESAAEQFRLQWLDKNDGVVGAATAAYVPAGESRVVRIKRPKAGAARLQLIGDEQDFDNSLFFTTRAEAELSVVYLGNDKPADPQGLGYYLERALADASARPIRFIAAASDKPLAIDSSTDTPLVVVSVEPTDSQLAELRTYSASGGTLLFVLTGDKPTAAWASLLDLPPLASDAAPVKEYTMLRQISFEHPLFAAMAGPHFNDFTQIHYWKYRQLKPEQLKGAEVIARFESGDPALAEWRQGKGRVLVLTSGWQPSDSQLARSWKFVLLVSALVEGNGAKTDRAYYLVNEPVPIKVPEIPDVERIITKPDGTQAVMPASAVTFTGAEMPGIYTLSTTDGLQTFAVNLDPQESRTATLGAESLEQFGCRLVHPTVVAKNDPLEKHLQDVALESRQKLWQWLIFAALGLLVAETWLAGYVTSPSAKEEVPA